jgi:hypothetical protein
MRPRTRKNEYERDERKKSGSKGARGRVGDEHGWKKIWRGRREIFLFSFFVEIHRYFELGFLAMIKGSTRYTTTHIIFSDFEIGNRIG